MESSNAQWYRVIARFKRSRTFLRIGTWVLLATASALSAAIVLFPVQRWWFAAGALVTFTLVGIAHLFARQVRDFEHTFAAEIEKYGSSPHADA